MLQSRPSVVRSLGIKVAVLLVVAAGMVLVSSTVASAQTTTYSATETIPAPPASNYAGTGGGDGWALAFSATEVFNVFHHLGTITYACHKQSDASACYPNRTIQDASGNNFASNGHPGMYFDDATGKLYTYATRGFDSTAGVVCIDTTIAATTANPFCGYTPLTPVGDGPTNPSWGTSTTSNPMVVGTKWYSFNYVNGNSAGAKNHLLCFDLNTKAACAGQPFAVALGTTDVNSGGFPEPATAAIDDHIIIPVYENSTGTGRLACFDASTGTNCAGAYPVTLGFSYVLSDGSPFPKLDNSGTTTGFCLPTGTDQCYSLAGASVATPSNMPSVINNNEPWNGPGVTLGSRVYVATGNGDRIQCFDYSANASCANFPHPTPGAAYIYTVNEDPQRPTCLWVNADNGGAQIQNFDAFTGGVCGEGPIRVLTSQFIVPQDKCEPTTYQTFQILDPARAGYSDGTVEFRDGNGNPISGVGPQPIDGTGSVDLTGLNLDAAAGLPQFLITLNNPTSPVGEVTVKLVWTGTYDPDCTDDDTTTQETPTTVTTTLHGGGNNGSSISVPTGTPVHDSATLAGDHSGSAGGTVTYTVYSNPACTNVVNAGSAQPISTPGTLPDSAPVTINSAGTYYWVASYSGDATNFSSKSDCGDEVLTVTGGPTEGPPGDATCSDGIDNDGDGQTDAADTNCQTSDDLCFGMTATIGGNGTVNGTSGDDVIITGNRADIVNGKGGDDRICTHGGADEVVGGGGRDRISGGNGDDDVAGLGGDDVVQGVNGNDKVAGEDGNDVLRGGTGNDTHNGGSGADNVYGEAGEDLLAGGPGAPDTCDGGADTDRETRPNSGCEIVISIP